MMTKLRLSLCVCSLLAGCAAQGPKHPIAPAPTCSSASDCTVKWAAARTFVLAHAGYKIQTYSPDFMETYNASGGDTYLAAQVNKQPLASGGYAIVAKFWCDNLFGCIPNQWDTLDQFNRVVAGAGAAGGN